MGAETRTNKSFRCIASVLLPLVLLLGPPSSPYCCSAFVHHPAPGTTGRRAPPAPAPGGAPAARAPHHGAIRSVRTWWRCRSVGSNNSSSCGSSGSRSRSAKARTGEHVSLHRVQQQGAAMRMVARKESGGRWAGLSPWACRMASDRAMQEASPAMPTLPSTTPLTPRSKLQAFDAGVQKWCVRVCERGGD